MSCFNKIYKVSPYSNVTNSNTCVAACFFRPLEYQKPIENLKIFLQDFSRTNIPLFTIELLYNNQKSIIENPTKIVRSNSVVFSKENLWNVIERYIPDQYSKIIFLDSDIRFTNPNWFNLSSDILDTYKVIQPMSYCYRSIHGASDSYEINERLRPSIAQGLYYNEEINIGLHYPGFSIGIDREFFHSIGGIFDLAFNGCGDSLFWASFDELGDRYVSIVSTRFTEYTLYRNNILKLIKNQKNIVSFVPNNTALHLYHGSDSNRKYRERDNYLPEHYETFYNSDNVLEIKSLDTNKIDLIQYWIDRKEDE